MEFKRPLRPLYYTACLEMKVLHIATFQQDQQAIQSEPKPSRQAAKQPSGTQEGMQGRMLPCNRRVDENEFCAVCQKKGKATMSTFLDGTTG